MASRREHPKCARACEYCRLKKIKCDGQQPCRHCVLRREECIVIPLVRKNTRERHHLLQMRAERAEALLAAAGIANPTDAIDCYRRTATTSAGPAFMPSPPPVSSPPTTQSPAIESPHEYRSAALVNQQRVPVAAPPQTHASASDGSSSRYGEPVFQPSPLSYPGANHHPRSQDPGLTPKDTSSTTEHHGPESFMSICSDSGAQWVSEQIGFPDFTNSATSMATTVSRNLKMARMEKQRKPEPSPETAWQYTKAYFEHTCEAAIATVNRSIFEARLQTHIQKGGDSDQDPAWYALRNTVYAFGCRFLLCQTLSKHSWGEAQTESWRYFENALSVHTELVYFPSNAAASESLLLMAMFVEGMGVPKLEYMLISNALSLAQSKALHLKPAPSSRVQPAEMAYRSWLFWSIYIYEKHISYRSGRPSAIDDEEITCDLPTVAPNGTDVHTQLFRCLIEHAQISSATMKNLSRTRTVRRSPAELISIVEQLDQRLRSWYRNIPQALLPDLPFKKPDLPGGVHPEHSLYLHFAYNGSLIAIHSFFGYPWNLIGFASDSNTDLRERMESSTKIVTEASRNLIRATRDISLDAEAPAWLVFYYPILGMINLFIHILRFPTLPTVPADIQLIDTIAAYFNYIDFSTASRLSYPFTRDLAHWARVVSEKARSTSPTTNATLQAMTPLSSTAETFQNCAEDDFTAQFGNLDPAEFGGVEDWPNFLSSMSQVPLMAWNDFSWNGQSNGRLQ